MAEKPGVPAVEKRYVTVGGKRIEYLTGGEGAPLVLLHGVGDSAASWQWVLPGLASRYRVYALAFPGSDDGPGSPTDSAPASLARLLAAFLDTLGIGHAALVGHSFGGLVALHFALAQPARVPALALVGSAGLGRAIHVLQAQLTLPGYGEMASSWAKTPLGAWQRARLRASILFWRLDRVPEAWLADQARLASQPHFLEATLATLRAQVTPIGQREVLLGQLARLAMPTLLLWGMNDMIVPQYQAVNAVTRLAAGRLVSIPECGHEPHVERPDCFLDALVPFLAEHLPRSTAAIRAPAKPGERAGPRPGREPNGAHSGALPRGPSLPVASHLPAPLSDAASRMLTALRWTTNKVVERAARATEGHRRARER